MNALISVSNKDRVSFFASELIKLGYKIISTGGTLKELRNSGIEVRDVSEITGVEEMFDGRVKTLHPKIHGGILYRRENQNDQEIIKKYQIEPIDIVAINLYPFKETTQKTNNLEEIIENIDIGGPALIRASAKNYESIIVVVDPNDYEVVIDALKNGKNSKEFRRALMIKAFEYTASYDAFIANYLNERFNNGFGAKRFIVGSKVFDTKYGENPHQRGSLYEFDSFFTKEFHIFKGEVSFNNLTDINAALKIVTSFKELPAVCIIKHANPCGFAIKDNLLDSYKEALKCDPISAYGGVLAINGVLDKELAEEINKHYIEVIIAADVSKEALDIFGNKKRIKIFSQKSNLLKIPQDRYDFRHIEGGFVFQSADVIAEDEIINSKLVSKKEANASQKRDLEIAYKIAAFTKSNSVVYVKDGVMVAIGMGMTSRVDASVCALKKASELGLDIKGSSMASEAFFPFRDSIDLAAKAGVSAIIEPGGSIRDNEVIEAANEHNIALYFSGIRHFLH